MLTDGGRIVLLECERALEEGDGRSSWTFLGNSQLKAGVPGSWCLTLKNINGSSAGLTDVIATMGSTCEASSTGEDQHGPQKAIDKDSRTSWISDLFEDSGEHLVTLDINIGTLALRSVKYAALLCMTIVAGKPTRLMSISIDWESPALSYAIQISLDGSSYALENIRTIQRRVWVDYGLLQGCGDKLRKSFCANK